MPIKVPELQLSLSSVVERYNVQWAYFVIQAKVPPIKDDNTTLLLLRDTVKKYGRCLKVSSWSPLKSSLAIITVNNKDFRQIVYIDFTDQLVFLNPSISNLVSQRPFLCSPCSSCLAYRRHVHLFYTSFSSFYLKVSSYQFVHHEMQAGKCTSGYFGQCMGFFRGT